jgi:hypothetical protein
MAAVLVASVGVEANIASLGTRLPLWSDVKPTTVILILADASRQLMDRAAATVRQSLALQQATSNLSLRLYQLARLITSSPAHQGEMAI